MSHRIWRQGFPLPCVGHGGLFLPGMARDEEWADALEPITAEHQARIMRSQERYAADVQRLYFEFWKGER